MNADYVLERLKYEDITSLTKRGRGVQLEQWCIWAGISEYGTNKEKAKRLLEWSAVQRPLTSDLHELVKEDLNFLKEMLELKNESMVVAYLAYYYLKNAAKVTLEEHKECCEYAKSLHEGKDMREWVIEKGLKKIHQEGIIP